VTIEENQANEIQADKVKQNKVSYFSVTDQLTFPCAIVKSNQACASKARLETAVRQDEEKIAPYIRTLTMFIDIV
jgi:hypothetical protein